MNLNGMDGMRPQEQHKFQGSSESRESREMYIKGLNDYLEKGYHINVKLDDNTKTEKLKYELHRLRKEEFSNMKEEFRDAIRNQDLAYLRIIQLGFNTLIDRFEEEEFKNHPNTKAMSFFLNNPELMARMLDKRYDERHE